jgi:thiol-disulfide isomerase/thioredoxin
MHRVSGFAAVLTLLVMAGCAAPSATTTTQPDEGDSGPAQAVEPSAAPASQVEAPTLIPTASDAPAEPVPVDGDYRFDPASRVASTGRPQLIEFFTTWCPNCQELKPYIHQMEADYWGRVDFVYIDREARENKAVVDQFLIVYQPVFILLSADGVEQMRWTYVDPQFIRDGIDEYLASVGG